MSYCVFYNYLHFSQNIFPGSKLSGWNWKLFESSQSQRRISNPFSEPAARHYSCSTSQSKPPISNHKMACAKPLTMLVTRSRTTVRFSNSLRPLVATTSPVAGLALGGFRAYATPSGPPPPGFRLPKPERWDQSKESSLDKAGKYFLLTEMARGMYVVLEQFFRPP